MPPIVTDGHLDPGTASARRLPFAAAIAALLVFLASAASVAAFWGGARLLTPTALTADLRLDPLVLPAGLALDPKIVADQLRQQLTAEADRDVAVRLTIGADNVKKLNEMIFPRLIGPNTIKRLIDRVAPLKAVLSLGQFRTTARVSVANAGECAARRRSDDAARRPAGRNARRHCARGPCAAAGTRSRPHRQAGARGTVQLCRLDQRRRGPARDGRCHPARRRGRH